jgi:hypothetical protein
MPPRLQRSRSREMRAVSAEATPERKLPRDAMWPFSPPVGDTSRPEGSIKGSIPTARCGSCKWTRKKKPRFAGLLQSPLTDSNRRPPPYHGTSQATGGNRSQRIWLVFALSALSRFAADCHRLQPRGSIRAPSGALLVSNRSRDSRRLSHHVRPTDHPAERVVVLI